MAKRFTDTEKWRDEWYGSLSNDYRIVWQYLCDSCSIAGIWKKDFRGLNFNCNTTLDEKTFIEIFGPRLMDRGNYFFIPKFLRFQYPKGLNSKKPAITSVVKELTLNNLYITVNELFGNDYLIVKDKDKVKDKDIDTVKDKETEKEKPAEIIESLDDIDRWTKDVIKNNDPGFTVLLKNRDLNINGSLEKLANDHLDLCSRYNWAKNIKTQQQFRNSLLKHIQDSLIKIPGKTGNTLTAEQLQQLRDI